MSFTQVPHATSLELEVRGGEEIVTSNGNLDDELENTHWRFKCCFSFEFSLRQPERSSLICDLELEGVGQLAELAEGNKTQTHREDVDMVRFFGTASGPRTTGASTFQFQGRPPSEAQAPQKAQLPRVPPAAALTSPAVMTPNSKQLKRKSGISDLKESKNSLQYQSEPKINDPPIRSTLLYTNLPLE
ncbi:hypothetical protein BDZ91DRAFT_763800 [Kalaharituber pfeilii]|nr:hypothetical protein BDZ91DRAFT_763800 [Kalaharituber pfeilii]